MDATATDVTILVVVVLARLVVPLFIPMFPLPSIIAALTIDGIDQTIFQTQLTPAFWNDIENGYQGYDKALDVYYLSLAYVATMRNWTNRTALAAAQFLWLYRLFGVTLFECVRDPADPSSWRWLLLVFPNTFEYFFIAYEGVRLRWDPRRMSPRLVVGLAAFIWIFIKLPQEWWIHVAQLDFTDFADEHSWVWPTVAVLVIAVVAIAWWAITYRLPPRDWRLHVKADPLPAELDTAAERAEYRTANWRLFDWNLVEKVTLVSLVCVIFSQMLPGSTATPSQVIVGVGTLVVVNSATGILFARRRWIVENVVAQFAVVVAMNIGLVWIGRALTPRFDPQHAMFFVLLISLIVVLYDRYRPMRELRRAAGRPDGPGAGTRLSDLTSVPSAEAGRRCQHTAADRQSLPAALASASISALSALICFSSTFSAFAIARSILAPMSDDADDDQPGLAGVQLLTEFLEVVAAHPGRGVTGHRAEHGAARRGGCQQATADRGEREQHDDQAGGQADAAAQHAADPGRRLVLLGDLHLAVGAPLDHGRVVGVDQPGLHVQVIDQVVVRLRVGDVGVDPHVDHEGVDRHPRSLLVRAFRTWPVTRPMGLPSCRRHGSAALTRTG